jgi:hypothetical protein
MFQRMEATVYRTEDWNGKPMLSLHFGPDQCILISESYGVVGLGDCVGVGQTLRRLCDILEWRNMAADDPDKWFDMPDAYGRQSCVLEPAAQTPDSLRAAA